LPAARVGLRFAAVPGLQRRFLMCLGALAAGCAVVQAVTGVSVALYLTPLFLIVALLLSGRFIGEHRIVARWRRSAVPARSQRGPQRWRPRPVPAPRSVLQQGSFGVRGPPAPLAPAA
jgi:hypothetical protein